QRLFSLIDHVPARLTAFGFAVVGNFQDAVDGWKRDAGLWKHANEGIILAAAAGAVGVQLGGSAAPGVTPDRSKTFSAGEGAAAASLPLRAQLADKPSAYTAKRRAQPMPAANPTPGGPAFLERIPDRARFAALARVYEPGTPYAIEHLLFAIEPARAGRPARI